MFRAMVPARWPPPARTVLAAAACLLLAGCQGRGADGRYVNGGEGVLDGGLCAAAAAGDGSLVLASDAGAVLVPPSAGEDGPERIGSAVDLSTGVTRSDRSVSAVVADLSDRPWVLVGTERIPVRADAPRAHAAHQALHRVRYGQLDTGTSGIVAADRPRNVTAATVVDDTTVLVATRDDVDTGGGTTRSHVLIHRVLADGGVELLAGRPWSDTARGQNPSDGLPAGRAVAATDVDLQQVVALVALAGGHALAVTEGLARGGDADEAGRLGFLLIQDGKIRRIEAGDVRPTSLCPVAPATRAADGTVLVDVLRPDGEGGTAPAVVRVDPGTAGASMLGDTVRPSSASSITVAAGDRWTTIDPRGSDPDDTRNADNVRIRSGELPGPVR